MSHDHCCVNFCNNDKRYESGKGLSFFNFPSNKKKKKEWIVAIKRDIGPNFQIKKDCTLVCSDHFKPSDILKSYGGKKRLKEGVVPSIFAWTKDQENIPVRPQNKLQLYRDNYLEKQIQPTNSFDQDLEIEDQQAALELDVSDNMMVESECVLKEAPNGQKLLSLAEQIVSLKNRNKELEDQVQNLNKELEDQVQNIEALKNRNKEVEDQVQNLEAFKNKIKELEDQVKNLTFGAERISPNSELLKYYTSFASKQLFDDFFHWIEPYASKMMRWSQVQRGRGNEGYRQSPGSSSLSLYDQFFLFMVRIRLGLGELDLACRFNVCMSTVSRTLLTWSNFLYCFLGQLPIWPSKSQIQETMPECFKNTFPETRVILDCTEIKVQRPSSKVLNSEFYSSYKSHTTYKCLVGIAPHGAVTFVSSLFQGSISDKQITSQSGILPLIEEGDEVMVDKGFPIDDLLNTRKAKLTIPPFLSRTQSMQFSAKEVTDTQKIARLRIHVERAIRRVKEFQIFDKVLHLQWLVQLISCGVFVVYSQISGDLYIEQILQL